MHACTLYNNLRAPMQFLILATLLLLLLFKIQCIVGSSLSPSAYDGIQIRILATINYTI